jgi:hypothetical protein
MRRVVLRGLRNFSLIISLLQKARAGVCHTEHRNTGLALSKHGYSLLTFFVRVFITAEAYGWCAPYKNAWSRSLNLLPDTFITQNPYE